MKFRNRLLFAFLVVIFLPVTLVTLVAGALTYYQAQTLRATYGTDIDISLTGTSANIIATVSERFAEKVREELYEDSFAFLDADSLKEYNHSLLQKNSYLIVLKNDEIVFYGSDKKTDLVERILKAERREQLSYDKKNSLFFTCIPIPGGTLKEGMVIVVTRGDATLPEIKRLTRELSFGVILILVLTAVALVLWIYRSIIVPIMKLRKAMQQVRDGNYDEALEVDDSEFGPLCDDFNQMRMRLKESEELQQKNEVENRELISNISHDLRTPITSIKGYVEGLMDGVADTPQRRERYLKTIYNKAIDMDRLIDELTFYSKVDTNRVPYRFDRVNVLEFFRDCAEEMSMELVSCGIKLSFESTMSPDTYVLADAEQMRRVVNNILTNSVKYMDKKQGLIVVSLSEDERKVYIRISDNGRGISEQALPHIFDRFYREDAARNTAKPGSGIGLSIVRKIVEDHGGVVYATSELGVGTTISIELDKLEEEAYEENSDH